MKRTFFAVKVSAETGQLIREIFDKLPETRQNFRPANLENPHITLKFIGDTRPEDLEKIDEKLRSEIGEMPAFSFTLDHCGCFPGAKRPRVLWLGVNKGLKKLQSLHKLIDNNLAKVNYEKDTREFLPHLTVGRVKGGGKIVAVDKFLNYRFESMENFMTEVIWFESLLTPRGAIHKPLRKYKLK